MEEDGKGTELSNVIRIDERVRGHLVGLCAVRWRRR